MSRTGMIGHILNREPGIYIHMTFGALRWIIVFVLIIAALCVHTIRININPAVPEYPMTVDNMKITFMGREPKSMMEARQILARLDRKAKDGDKVMVNE